jgi:hypothetical protein
MVMISSRMTEGRTQTAKLSLFLPRAACVEYVYQPNGSTSFEGSKVKRGTVVWNSAPRSGMAFAQGTVESRGPCDLALVQEQAQVSFHASCSRGKNCGLYDEGAATFDAIKDVKPMRIGAVPCPCLADHVYVVETTEGKFAKFVVKEIRVIQTDGDMLPKPVRPRKGR